jgi:hypothetical protein
MANSLIHAYGLFWRRDEIDWTPGAGNSGKFRLLGRSGSNKGNLRVIDARLQCGIYILYGNYGPYYVGITRKALGWRLKHHLTNKHDKQWDRFSWFGFKPVFRGKDGLGVQKLGSMAETKAVSPRRVIGDVEALLIRAMALENVSQMKFATADQWKQIKLTEVDGYLKKL